MSSRTSGRHVCGVHGPKKRLGEKISMKHAKTGIILAISTSQLGPVVQHGFEVSILQLKTQFSRNNIIKVTLRNSSPKPTSLSLEDPVPVMSSSCRDYAIIRKMKAPVQSTAARQVAQRLQDPGREGSSRCNKRSKLALCAK